MADYFCLFQAGDGAWTYVGVVTAEDGGAAAQAASVLTDSQGVFKVFEADMGVDYTVAIQEAYEVSEGALE